MNKFKQVFPNFHLSSLRVRLTVGIAVFSACGLGGLSTWTGWKMQQLLINSHKDNIEQILSRLPIDVEVYSQMLPRKTALERAITNRATGDTLLWVQASDNQTLFTSSNFQLLPESSQKKLISLTKLPTKPQVYHLQNQTYIICSNDLNVAGQTLGKIFITKDITRDQNMFIAIIQSLNIATIITILLMSFLTIYYVRQTLHPLLQISRMTQAIQADDLGTARLYLHNLPTEVKELAQTVNLMLSRLSNAWEKERQFTSNISHELRTSLTIVHGYLQSILRRQQNLTEIQTEALSTAAAEAERTIHILEDLLDLVRADSGYLQLNMESCILDDIVNEVVHIVRKNTQREIHIKPDNHQISITIDRNRLKQILINLIDNAVKYSPPDTPIKLKLKQQQAQAIIQVCDRGYGISWQNQSRIFERFYRVDESRTRSGGTGLGLSLVKTLVEKMNGTVSVSSKLGEGSIFTVSFPR